MLHHKIGNTEFYLRIRALAREMRQNSTEAENFFWQKVRNRRLFNWKFNRQVIIQYRMDNLFTKFYIADFHCALLKLIIEIDGKIHNFHQEDDLIRTDQMLELGYTVIRFSNQQILEQWEEVEETIKKYLTSI